MWVVRLDSEAGWICQADSQMERKRLKLPTGEVVDTHHSCKLSYGNTFLSGTPREEDRRCFGCCSSAWCRGVELHTFLRVSSEAQGHVLPSCAAAPLRTHLPLYPVPSLQSPLTIALGPHEAADTTEMTSVAVSLTRRSWTVTKSFEQAFSLCLPLVLFLSLETQLTHSARSQDFSNFSCKVSWDRAPLCCFSRLLVLSRSLKLSQNCSDFSLTSTNWSSGALTLRLAQPRPGDYFGMSAFPAHAGWKLHLSNTN